MRDAEPSRTAAWVASARSLGRMLPRELQLADDPYGVAFASTGLPRLLGELPPLARVPGMRTWLLYMQVRTRVLDDAVRAFVAAGGRQLVLLGAGYDCRALRLPELAHSQAPASRRDAESRSTVYEIDHPATQGHKRATLERIGAHSPARYVTWDFEARPLAELPAALARAGHDSTRPTLTLWEGVTMYLTAPAIDASLRAIRAWSAAGSELAMTYFARARLAAPSLRTRAVSAIVARFGEPWRWGWDPAELPAYLGERGWTLARDLPMSEAAQALLPAAAAARVADPERRIAMARVALPAPL